MKQKLTLTLLGTIFPLWILAQQDTATLSLKEFVVSATRTDKKVAETGRSVTVITSEEVRESIYDNVADLLSRQEGISIIGSNLNPGSTQSIFTRGAGSNHTVIMIDGVPISDPSAINNALDLSELSLSNIEKIEIVRGSHSTLYGSSAIGGVVNIITKGNDKQGFHADARLGGGTFGSGTSEFTEQVHLNYSHESGFYVNANIFNTNVSGLDATVDTITNPNTYNVRDNDHFAKMELQGKLGFKGEKLNVFAAYKVATHALDIDDGAYNDDDNYTIDFVRNLITYSAEWKVSDKISLKLTGGMSDMERKAVNDSSLIDDQGTFDHSYWEGTYTGSTMNNELQAAFALKGINLVLGGGMFAEEMNQQTYYYSNAWGPFELETNLDSIDPNSSTANAYAQAELNGSLLSDKWSPFNLLVGARYNNHSNYGQNTTFQLNPSLKVGDGALIYVAYTTGFNSPSLYRLYTPETQYISGITRGNPNLQPEESVSVEFGFKQNIGDKLTVTASYYNTVVNNVIEYVYLWDGSIAIDSLGDDWLRDDSRGDTYINLGVQTVNGIELGVMTKLSKKLILNTNINLVSGKLNYDPADLDTSHTQGNHVQLFESGAFIVDEIENFGLTRRSGTANISLTCLPVEKLSVRFDARYVGSRSDIRYDGSLGPWGALGTTSVPDYTLFDIGIRYMVNEHISIAVKMENILDEQYTEIIGFTTRGRGFCGRLGFRF